MQVYRPRGAFIFQPGNEVSRLQMKLRYCVFSDPVTRLDEIRRKRSGVGSLINGVAVFIVTQIYVNPGPSVFDPSDSNFKTVDQTVKATKCLLFVKQH